MQPFTSKTVTDIKLSGPAGCIYNSKSSSNELSKFEEVFNWYPLLEVLKIESVVIRSHFFSQQNNLHTLSLDRCKLSSEATSSLIHSLQSPHCRLHKLALYNCTIPTTDRTLLITAIVSSTTITHLLFFHFGIDTPSLTALASGLKQNRTMEELAVDDCYGFTKDAFQLLIESVDSSAVQKLIVQRYYKKLLSDCPLSRDDMVIEWYNYNIYVYMKW